MPIQSMKLTDKYGIYAVGNAAVHCHRCGGEKHIAAKCGGKRATKVRSPRKVKRQLWEIWQGKAKMTRAAKRVNVNGVVHIAASLFMHGPRDCWITQEVDAETI